MCLCNTHDLTDAWPRNGQPRGSDDGSLRRILVQNGSNHTWSGSLIVRAGKQSFLALSRSLFLPQDTHHANRHSLTPAFSLVAQTGEQLRALDTSSPFRTHLALPNSRRLACQIASQVSRTPDAPHIQVFQALTASRLPLRHRADIALKSTDENCTHLQCIQEWPMAHP